MLDEGEQGMLTTMLKSVQGASRGVQTLVLSTMVISTWIWCVLSNVYPSQSSLLKSHRSCAYAASEIYLIIEVGQMSGNGKEGETRTVTAEEGGVYECIADGYSS